MPDNRGEYLLKQRAAHDGEHDLAGKILCGDDGARRDIAHAAGKAHGGRLAIRQMQGTCNQKTDDKAADGEGQNKEGAFMCRTYSLMAVELDAMTPIIMNLQAGESAGESFS